MRSLNCLQCRKFIEETSDPEMIGFCDSVCLNSYVIEETTESKDEMLQALSYAQNREDLEA